jgi:hypothetical protein
VLYCVALVMLLELLHESSQAPYAKWVLEGARPSFWLTKRASPHHCLSSMPPPPTKRQNEINFWNYFFSLC